MKRAKVNDCGNGELPLNVWCQNTASQIQGDENVVSMASSQVFGADGNGPTPPPPRDECTECFEPLSDPQVEQLAEVLADRFVKRLNKDLLLQDWYRDKLTELLTR